MRDASGTLADTNAAEILAAREGRSAVIFTNTHATATIRLLFGANPTAATGLPIGPNAGYTFSLKEHGESIGQALKAKSDTAGATFTLQDA